MWVKVPCLFQSKDPEQFSEIDALIGVQNEYWTATMAVNLSFIGAYGEAEMEGTINGKDIKKECTSINVQGVEFILFMTVEEWEAILYGGQELQTKWECFLSGEDKGSNPDEG